jgi:excisionase family DNA binding protein
MDASRAHNISEVCALSRASRTVVYEAIKAGELVARKRGRRTIVLSDDLAAWLKSLPAVVPKP